MSGQRYISLISLLTACALMLGSFAFALEKGNTEHAPVVITSESLEVLVKKNLAVFEGSVVAHNDDMTLRAELMKVYSSSDGDLLRIESEGSVKFVREGQVLTSDRAVYTEATRTMVFTGNPRAVQQGNVLLGSSILYLLDEDRIKVQESKVFLDTGGADASKR
jgi:lipopolysaccharide transport protein LptA